jgi:TolB-like protein/Tfp pilus assembly protein PilF
MARGTAASNRARSGIWTRLRRRKVVQWGIAYAAGAWGLLQGLAYVTDTFYWPERVQQLATIALLVGLPVVLVLAWYHGDRGEQRVSAAEITIIAVFVLLGGGLLWQFGQPTGKPLVPNGAARPAPAATIDARPSVAVLPFDNRGNQSDDAFFVDGIHDDILTQLSKISALKVISRTSVEQFRDTRLPTQEIAQQLGVTNILEGGVQRVGDRVRINVQLIDADTDAHLWAETYDRELTAANIFAIQSEVAAAISGALKATLSPEEKTRVDAVPTQSLAAWEAYQLGRQRMARRTSAGLADAERFFREAIDLDPAFALAYVGLADTLVLQPQYSGAALETSLEEAARAASKASELRPDLAEAWASSALLYARAGGQDDRAETMYRRAISLNPNYATAHQWFSDMLGMLGRREEALIHARRAADLDPLSAIINTNLAEQLASTGRFDEADARLRKAITIDPSMPVSHLFSGLTTAYARNRFADAIPFTERAMELDPDGPNSPLWLAILYLDLGRDAQTDALIEAVRKRWPGNVAVDYFSALVQWNRGDLGAANRHAEVFLERFPRSHEMLVIARDADLAGNFRAARSRYAAAYPELVAPPPPRIDGTNCVVAIDLVPVLLKTGEIERARVLLDQSEQVVRTIPRLGIRGHGIADVRIHALRGQKKEALVALRDAEQVGWRRGWRYARDVDPSLGSIRNEPEFKSIFADIERDMARQRAALAARPTL